MAATSAEHAIYNPSNITSSAAAPPTQINPTTFIPPPHTIFPPFYTLQPNLQTRTHQLDLWSTYITTYCTHHHLFRLNLSSPPPSLFTNPSIARSLKPADIRTVLDHMALPSNGSRIEWFPPATKGQQSETCYVFWRSAGEWADLIYAWVEETGQKGAVLTVYELREGDAVSGRKWREMDEGMLRKVLGVLVKRGKAQIFGQGSEGEGVKFF